VTALPGLAGVQRKTARFFTQAALFRSKACFVFDPAARAPAKAGMNTLI
jgi:hypothetical protein